MIQEIIEEIFENFSSKNTFHQIRGPVLEKLDEIIKRNSFDFLNIFIDYYSHEKKLKLKFPHTFSLINIAFCEKYVEIIKGLDLGDLKLGNFITIFQLYLSKYLMEELKMLDFDNLERIFLYLGLLIELFRKTKGFCPEIFAAFNRILRFFKQKYYEIDEIFIKWIIVLLKAVFVLLSNDSNLDLLMKETVGMMQDILEKIKESQLKKEFKQILERLFAACTEAEQKQHLSIFKEQPLIKIKQLTPKIVESSKKNFSSKTDNLNDKDKKARVKILKKQVKFQSKKIKKDIEAHNSANFSEKKKLDDHMVSLKIF